MTALIAALIPVAMQLFLYFLKMAGASKEQKEAYLEFINHYNKMGNASKAQHDDVEGQLADLKNKKADSQDAPS